MNNRNKKQKLKQLNQIKKEKSKELNKNFYIYMSILSELFVFIQNYQNMNIQHLNILKSGLTTSMLFRWDMIYRYSRVFLTH